VREAVAAVRKALEGEDVAAIRAATEELTRSQHAVAQALYQHTAQSAAGSQPGAGEPAAAGEGTPPAPEGEVIDAEYEDVN
jgi:molecular chaperone DnaK